MSGRKLNLIGQKFGKLTVLEKSESVSKSGSRMWLCECVCGNKKEYSGGYLNSGRRTSCGCRRGNELWRRRPKGQAGLVALYGRYKASAAHQKISFDIDIEKFRELTSSPCHYCGEPPCQISAISGIREETREHGTYYYNGLDKVDPKGGYTLDNVVPACKGCNYSKGTMSQKDFMAWLETTKRYSAMTTSLPSLEQLEGYLNLMRKNGVHSFSLGKDFSVVFAPNFDRLPADITTGSDETWLEKQERENAMERFKQTNDPAEAEKDLLWST